MKKLLAILLSAASVFAASGALAGLDVIANRTDVPLPGTDCDLNPSTADCGSCTIGVDRDVNKISLRPRSTSAITGAVEDAYLPVGTNKYTVTVGSDSYAICIIRDAGTEAVDTKNTLSDLKVSSESQIFVLNPNFLVDVVKDYAVAIPYETSSVTVDATLSYRYGGGPEYLDADNEKISNEITGLVEGVPWIVKIKVIAESATVPPGIYNLTITRAEGSTNNKLSALEVYLNGDAFDNVLEDFDQDVISYQIQVPNTVTKATVKGTKDDQYFGEIITPPYTNVSLAVGNNSFPVTVKPQKSTNTNSNKTYTVTINREAPPPPPPPPPCDTGYERNESGECVLIPTPPPPPPPPCDTGYERNESGECVLIPPPPPPPPSSSSVESPPSSSSVEPPPSSSSVVPPSSSSSAGSVTQSSSSNGNSPIRLLQTAAANQAMQIYNGVNLQATNSAIVEIFNLNGVKISKQEFGSGVYSVSFGHLPKGMYIVKISFGSEKKMLKMPVR